jgi:hypothetical protein
MKLLMNLSRDKLSLLIHKRYKLLRTIVPNTSKKLMGKLSSSSVQYFKGFFHPMLKIKKASITWREEQEII